jgi:hypothetical protein
LDTHILKDVIEDAFSAIINCGEIGHMLKRFVFTTTYTPKQVEQEALYQQHYIIKNALDEVLVAYAI